VGVRCSRGGSSRVHGSSREHGSPDCCTTERRTFWSQGRAGTLHSCGLIILDEPAYSRERRRLTATRCFGFERTGKRYFRLFTECGCCYDLRSSNIFDKSALMKNELTTYAAFYQPLPSQEARRRSGEGDISTCSARSRYAHHSQTSPLTSHKACYCRGGRKRGLAADPHRGPGQCDSAHHRSLC